MALDRRTVLAGLAGLATAGAVGRVAVAAPGGVKGRPKPKPTPTPTPTPPSAHVKTFTDGVGLREYSIIVGPPGVGGGQSAVTLVAADGEIIVGDSQSNFLGDGWYGRKGHTYAANWTGPNPIGGPDFDGYDDPNFVLQGIGVLDFGGTGFYSRMDDLALTGMLPAAGSVSLANNITFGKSCFVDGNVHASGSISAGNDPGVVGYILGEEPGDMASYNAIVSSHATWGAGADGPGRMSYLNYADNILNGDIDNTVFPADMVDDPWDIISADQYWYAGSVDNAGGSQFKLHFRMYQNQGGNATTAQCQRGSHYGSQVDCMRKAFTPANSAPFWPSLENGGCFTEATSYAPTPAQFKWAFWSVFVHNCRAISIFNHTFRAGDPGAGSNNLNDNYYGGPGVPGTGIYAAVKECCTNALSIASVINSPSDGYFVYADDDLGTIATTGFLTAVSSTNSRGPYGGIDATCKWEPVEQKHYILSTTREVSGSTSWPVTFRMVDQGQTTAHPMFTGSDITISRGGAIPGGFCEFADTFATAETYKVYRID